jgi:prepilin-type N-terminal cleavage/methylation domain-containing protein
MKNSLKPNLGFTLVETLVAVSILSLSVVATFTAVQNGLQNSSIAKDQITAFYLAQEAMEFIKNRRDENALYTINGGVPAHSWLWGLSETNDVSNPCWFGKVCMIDSPAKTITYCGMTFSAGTCTRLKQDPTTGLFGYSYSSQTIFRRGIQFTEIVPNREVLVTIEMNWTSRWGEKSFQVSELLFNRQ